LQIVVLYRALDAMAPSPMVTLNLAVAAAMLHGPQAGLRMTEPLLDNPALRHTHRLFAVRSHLLEQAGDRDAARAAYERAASLATSIPEQCYLIERLAALGPQE
jgi:predicted RNA polymerase sigma factor